MPEHFRLMDLVQIAQEKQIPLKVPPERPERLKDSIDTLREVFYAITLFIDADFCNPETLISFIEEIVRQLEKPSIPVQKTKKHSFNPPHEAGFQCGALTVILKYAKTDPRRIRFSEDALRSIRIADSVVSRDIIETEMV